MSKLNPDFADRQKTSAEAKKALLEKMRANAPSNRPGFLERQAERAAVAEAREKRQAERAAQKAIEAEQRAKEEEANRVIREQEAEAARQAAELEKNRAAIELAELRAAQKANRDAKYAARQARRDQRGSKK